MKYLMTGIVLQLFAMSAFSVTLTSRIHSIDKGEKGQPDLIMLESGETAFIKNSSKMLDASMQSGDTVEVRLDKKRNVIAIQTVGPAKELAAAVAPLQVASYDPSIVTTEQARSAFTNMRRDYQNQSQCYNRAHIWTYEEFNRTGMRSGKLFLFFTSKYIRNYRYKWWFHVTPFAYVGGTDQSNWRTMDRRYTAGILTTKTWTDVFMLNNATCPVVSKYTDYRNHQQSQDCYLIPTSMYFWQPRDIEYQGRTDYVKTKFYTSEINHAYWEAF